MNPVLTKSQSNNREKGNSFLTCMFCVLFFLSALPMVLMAQDSFPNKPVTLYVGYNPGGSSDITCRALIPTVERILGQPLVVRNKPGGGAVVMNAFLSEQKPDGYTIGALTTGPVAAQFLRDDVPYKILDDFTPIMQIGQNQYGLVVKPDSPWKTFKEFIDYAKANPGEINYSTAGIGSPQHLVMERLALKENIKWTHVPFEGGSTAVQAVLGGHVKACSGSSEWKKHAEAGRLIVIAVYGEKRMIEFPETSTLLELGYNITAPTILGLTGPIGMDPQVVETLHKAFKKAIEDEKFIEVVTRLGLVIKYRSPEEFRKHLVELNDQMGSLIQRLGIKK